MASASAGTPSGLGPRAQGDNQSPAQRRLCRWRLCPRTGGEGLLTTPPRYSKRMTLFQQSPLIPSHLIASFQINSSDLVYGTARYT